MHFKYHLYITVLYSICHKLLMHVTAALGWEKGFYFMPYQRLTLILLAAFDTAEKAVSGIGEYLSTHRSDIVHFTS